MADVAKPPIFRSAVTGWLDAFMAVSSMGTVAGIAFLFMVAMGIVNLPLLPDAEGNANLGRWGELISFAIGIAQSFLETPLAIAVHRYVLLGEVTQRYALTPSDPRFIRFFGFAVAVSMVITIPSLLLSAVMVLGGATAFVLSVIALAWLFVAFIVVVRSVILFPAVAVDAPGAHWANALRDTKGHSWRVFFVVTVTLLPTMILYVPFYWLLVNPAGSSLAAKVVGAVLGAAVSVVTLAALAAVASRLYRALADRLGPPAGSPVPAPA